MHILACNVIYRYKYYDCVILTDVARNILKNTRQQFNKAGVHHALTFHIPLTKELAPILKSCQSRLEFRHD